MTDHLIETFEDGVATLTFNRPEARNALSGDMGAKLSEAIPRLSADPRVRVIVLTGNGGAFCAGGDVKGFAADTSRGAAPGQGQGPSLEARTLGLRRGMEVVKQIYESPKPTLAIIPGPAAGAGFSIALACDLRVSLDTAKLTTAFSKVGLAGDYGGSFFLSHLVGAAKARELYFTADVITGAEAERLGIVNKAVPADQLEAEGKAWAKKLAALPTVAVGYMKKNLNASAHATLSEVLDMEAMHMVRTMTTADHAAASQAFVEKRAPVFAGR
jgi:2-(1,2-epoxy-1,2-dihydrophenyl)acetyl-CoA isomerase